jgi:hypothetical protein
LGVQFEHFVFSLKVRFQLLRHRLPHPDRAQPLHVRNAFEIEDMLDHFVCILHLVEAALPDLVVEPLVAPVLAHFGVHEILINSRQVHGQDSI